MSKLIKVEGSSSLARDPSTGAIININKEEVQKARLAKAGRKQQEKELQDLKNDVSDIKILLRQLLEKS